MSIRAAYGAWPQLNASMTEAVTGLSDDDLARLHAQDLWHAAEANEILTRLGRAQIDPWGP